MSSHVKLIGQVSHYYVSGKYGTAWVRVLSSDSDFASIPILWETKYVNRTIEPFGDGNIVEVEGELRWIKKKDYETMVVKVKKLRLTNG